VRAPLPQRVLFATTNILFHALQETLGASSQAATRFGIGRALVISRGYEKFGLMRGAVGAPAAAIVLEEAIAAGAREIMVVGTAFPFSSQVSVGDILLPTEVVIADGTSPNYVSPRAGAKPDRALRDTLAQLLERGGAVYRSGRVASWDAVYVRPPQRLQSLRRARVLAVDMELAALLAVSRYRNVRCAAVLVVSGPPAGLPNETSADRPIFLNAVVRAATALAHWAAAPADRK
jgi:uridine phosphorylase